MSKERTSSERGLSRRRFLKVGGGVALGTVASGLVASCRRATDAPASPAAATPVSELSRKGEPLIVAAPSTPTGFDRELDVTTADLEQTNNVFANALTWDTQPAEGIPEPLEAYEQDAYELVPSACEDWELTDGGERLVLRVREGMISNYGNEITAEDAVWTYERVYPLGGASTFLFFEGAYGDPETSDIEVIDKYTFAITARCANAMLARSQASNWQWFYDATEAKKHATDDDPWATEWLSANPCGHGPYLVEDFKPQEQVVYRANPDFFGSAPRIDQVIYRQVPSSATRTALIRRGEVDVATFLRPDELAQLEGVEGVKVLYFRGNYLTYLVPNQKQFEPAADLKVRRALAYATPQREIGETIYNGHGEVMDSVVASTFPHYNGEFYEEEYDPDKARALLDEAGYGDGLEFTAMYTQAIPELVDVGTVLQTAYSEIGVNMKLELRPPASYFDALYGPSKNFEAALSRELAIVPDPVHSTYQFFYSDSVINTCQVEDPELDAVLEESLCATEEQRGPVFDEIQRTIMEKVLWIPIWAPGNQVAIREDLLGYTWQFNNGFYWPACYRA